MEVRLAHEEKFKTVERRLDEGEARMDDHDKQLARIFSISAAFDEKFKSLIIEIERTNSNLEKTTEQNKWFMRLLVGAFIGFFFYAAQKGLL